MGKYSISITDDDVEEFMEKCHQEGDFANRSHVVEVALKRMKENKSTEHLV